MKAKEMRERSVSELQGMERDLSRELWKTRFTNFTNQLDDTAKLRRLRREIARVKTILTEKGPAEASPKSE
jgi:large subunit ribosomal protein L29